MICVRSWGSEAGELSLVLDLLARGELRLAQMVGEVIGLDDVLDGLERLACGRTAGPRIVVDMAA